MPDTSTIPATIPFARVEVALARFGVPLDGLQELVITRRGMTATHLRRDTNGDRTIGPSGQELGVTVVDVEFTGRPTHP